MTRTTEVITEATRETRASHKGGAAPPPYAALAQRCAATQSSPGQARLTGRVAALVIDGVIHEGHVGAAFSNAPIRGTRLGNVLWIVALNRQSLDGVIPSIKVQQM